MVSFGDYRVAWQTVCVKDSCRVQVGTTRRFCLHEAAASTASYAPSALTTALLDAQASRVQFVFDDEALEVLIKSKDDKAEESENKFVGGQNRWSYDAFSNWEFWWKKFPVLVYFKVCSINTSCGLWHHCCDASCTTLIQNSKGVCMGTQNARKGSAAWLKVAMMSLQLIN